MRQWHTAISHRFPAQAPLNSPDIAFSYQPSGLTIVNNGHTIQANYDGGSSITVDDTPYNLVQFHFHNTSEHTAQGQYFPMEVHFVGKVFRDLKDLAVGDPLTIYAGDTAFDYVVTQRMIVREALASIKQRQDNARWIGPFPDERVTLVTCWPAWTNTHRLIVVAQPVDQAPERPLPSIAPPTGRPAG